MLAFAQCQPGRHVTPLPLPQKVALWDTGGPYHHYSEIVPLKVWPLLVLACLFENWGKKYRNEISGRDGGGENTVPGAIKP